MLVAKPAASTAGEGDRLSDFGKIGEQGFVILVVNLGAERHIENHIVGAFAAALFAHAVLPA